ncbi:MAG TPA: hypothetical protein VMV18_05560 [bacterium]|nr:hypothetical protein [bacterium]
MKTPPRRRAVSLSALAALAAVLAVACSSPMHHVDPHATDGEIDAVVLHAGTALLYSLHAELVRPVRPDLAGMPRGTCATPAPTVTPTKWLDAGASITLLAASSSLAMTRATNGATITYDGTPASLAAGDYTVNIPGGPDLLPIAFPGALTVPAPVVMAGTTMTLAATGPTTVTWNAGSGDFVRLVWIDPIDGGDEGECFVPDTGSFAVAQDFANALPLKGDLYLYRYVVRERDDSAVRLALGGASGWKIRFFQP